MYLMETRKSYTILIGNPHARRSLGLVGEMIKLASLKWVMMSAEMSSVKRSVAALRGFISSGVLNRSPTQRREFVS
jgi:hypothetical protein